MLGQCCTENGMTGFYMEIEWLVSIWNATLGWNDEMPTNKPFIFDLSYLIFIGYKDRNFVIFSDIRRQNKLQVVNLGMKRH